ncbi:hypothetical protein PVAP13_1KG363925 [Panicum virgatum]|uniref:Uncharacterized protein n=1 Tax=Panicum virgatum TaxID=38727 RepID=A0A8T0XMK5_PANVG|nr:hypothetical protein PVAP13_1KG363925 [Panicum virgatum]
MVRPDGRRAARGGGQPVAARRRRLVAARRARADKRPGAGGGWPGVAAGALEGGGCQGREPATSGRWSRIVGPPCRSAGDALRVHLGAFQHPSRGLRDSGGGSLPAETSLLPPMPPQRLPIRLSGPWRSRSIAPWRQCVAGMQAAGKAATTYRLWQDGADADSTKSGSTVVICPNQKMDFKAS